MRIGNKLLALAAASLAFMPPAGMGPQHEVSITGRRAWQKTPLTSAQKRRRKAGKTARKSRKINRRKV